MTDTEDQNRRRLIEKLEKLSTEFQKVAEDVRGDTSRWPRRNAKDMTAATFEKYAKQATSTADKVRSEKSWTEVITFFNFIAEDVNSLKDAAEKNAAGFSLYKKGDQKDAELFKDSAEKVNNVIPLIKQAMGL